MNNSGSTACTTAVDFILLNSEWSVFIFNLCWKLKLNTINQLTNYSSGNLSISNNLQKLSFKIYHNWLTMNLIRNQLLACISHQIMLYDDDIF